MFSQPGMPMYAHPSGALLGFTNGYGGVGDPDTVKKMYHSPLREELYDEVARRIDEAVARDAAKRSPARPEELLRAGRSREPERFGRTAEIDHTFTRAWIVSNSSAGGIRIGALEGVLRKLGISDKFRIEHDGTLTPVGSGLGADMVSDIGTGNVTVTFKWRA